MNDLQRKTEEAVIAKLKSHPDLSGIRFRHNVEESTRVNQDIVVIASLGEQDPPFSGIFSISLAIQIRSRVKKEGNMQTFLNLCTSVEQTLVQNPRHLAKELSGLVDNFYCYEFLIMDKDNTPMAEFHSCLWGIKVVAMAKNYADPQPVT